ncbi:oxidoreductase [Aurantimonas endophytica]|nr:oxidoreductase [Aurantimonas endophytica]MCO6403126.1 SDR family NAD(P)-dependent oxidoreductase [Aurantimonas endophytica]
MKTIVITGVSSGLGRVMAEEALSRGHKVVGTLRQKDQQAAFEAISPGRSIGRIMDVTDLSQVSSFARTVEDEVGPIDVLVNNAGFGLTGVIEELDLDALRRQFDVNVFGPVALIQAVLPFMRERKAGHVVNIVSQGGIITFPGLGAYHGSKFALLGINDALAKEVSGLGIHVTAILPGLYRSEWSGRSQVQTDHNIADYDAVLRMDGELNWGDPAALGRVVLDAIEMSTPPEHLLVGPSAIKNVKERLAQWSSEIERWQPLSFADGEG